MSVGQGLGTGWGGLWVLSWPWTPRPTTRRPTARTSILERNRVIKMTTGDVSDCIRSFWQDEPPPFSNSIIPGNILCGVGWFQAAQMPLFLDEITCELVLDGDVWISYLLRLQTPVWNADKLVQIPLNKIHPPLSLACHSTDPKKKRPQNLFVQVTI